MKQQQHSFEYLWGLIEASFRWDRVYVAMKALDWQWCIDKHNDLYGIPTVDTLKKSAKKILYEAYERKAGGGSSGGFSGGYEDGELWLEFSLDSWSTSNDHA